MDDATTRAAPPKFEVGDFVQLRSGGPAVMVVQRWAPGEKGSAHPAWFTYRCDWFSNDRANKKEWPEPVLQHYDGKTANAASSDESEEPE